VRDLDQPVGVEDQRVTAVQVAGDRLVGDLGDQPEREALGLQQRPAPAARVELRDRRVPGRLHREAAVLQVQHQVHRGREALVPLLPVEVAVRGRQELLRPQGPQQPAERAGQQQRAGAGLGALAGDVDQRQLEDAPVRGQRAHHEVTGERRPAGRAHHRLHPPRRRHAGQPPGVLQPRPELEQEGVPGRADQPGLLPAQP
jgi:hypothetical protein